MLDGLNKPCRQTAYLEIEKLTCSELPDYPKPMKVSAQYAEEHFADLLTAAGSGI